MLCQVSGPIDVGYGNYILTGQAQADRQGRRRRRKQKEGAAAEEEEEEGDNTASNMRSERGHKSFDDKMMPDGKYDVSELLSLSNTLTNPNNEEKYKKSEL